MPIYDYTCQACTTQFPVRRRISEADSPIVCPTCRTSDGGNGSRSGCSGCGGGSCSSCGH